MTRSAPNEAGLATSNGEFVDRHDRCDSVIQSMGDELDLPFRLAQNLAGCSLFGSLLPGVGKGPIPAGEIGREMNRHLGNEVSAQCAGRAKTSKPN
jgi:hypothetical protein